MSMERMLRHGRAMQRAPRSPTPAVATALALAVTSMIAISSVVPAASAAGAASGGGNEAPGAASDPPTAAAAQGTGTQPEEKVVFTQAYLNDPANIEAGEAVWKKQCRHCHGSAAYPGKAPKLKPRKYTADFVYDRVTYGFRKMPSWASVFSREERMAVAAYVLSREFSP